MHGSLLSHEIRLKIAEFSNNYADSLGTDCSTDGDYSD